MVTAESLSRVLQLEITFSYLLLYQLLDHHPAITLVYLHNGWAISIHEPSKMRGQTTQWLKVAGHTCDVLWRENLAKTTGVGV